MIENDIVKRAGARGASPLDLPMAALAALSVAFVAYAMPDPLFSGAVEATGLPGLLPAAQPPLGSTARLAVVIAGTIAAFLCTWLLLRALGTRPSSRRRAFSREVHLEAPRLRRADAHPDAPSRRPLVAGLDLGEPFIEIEQEIPAAPEPWGHDLPRFIADGPAVEEVSPLAEQSEFVADPGVEPPIELEVQSIGDLMRRLELGVARRRHARAASAPAAAPASEPVIAANMDEPADEPAEDRLRSALDALQKMAARGV